MRNPGPARLRGDIFWREGAVDGGAAVRPRGQIRDNFPHIYPEFPVHSRWGVLVCLFHFAMLTLNTLAVPSRALICFILLLCFSLFTLLWHQGGYTAPGTQKSFRTFRQKSTTKNYAYTTFLAPAWDLPENATDDDDNYYTGTRMLLYQLVHDPKTRSPNKYPFVVLVTADVPQSKRDRLTLEGAIVKELEAVPPLQHETRKAWKDVITKLRLFEMVEYDLVAFFDSDHILTRPMDGEWMPSPCGIWDKTNQTTRRYFRGSGCSSPIQ